MCVCLTFYHKNKFILADNRLNEFIVEKLHISDDWTQSILHSMVSWSPFNSKNISFYILRFNQ